MPSPIANGDSIGRYRVADRLNEGNKAFSYRAEGPDGKPVFLKQYFEPTPISPWYRDYIKYEERKRDRIRGSEAARFCLVPTEIFEFKYRSPRPLLFQAFDFVQGKDLAGVLIDLKRGSAADTWGRRLTYARVFLAALDSIAKIGVVHGDLKPENVQLIEDTSIAVGYRPYLIDMDASILTDSKAPWDGDTPFHTGYMGTPRYYSPEHVSGQIPLPASDVFTASLMLHELLCVRRPYPDYSSPVELRDLIAKESAPMPSLLGTTGSASADENLRRCLRQALQLDPARRPLISELREAVMGKAPTPAPPPAPPAHAGQLCLKSATGGERPFNISCELGRSILQMIDRDASWLPGKVARLDRTIDGSWCISPVHGAVRLELDGAGAIAGPTPIRSGTRITLSSASGQRLVLEATIR